MIHVESHRLFLVDMLARVEAGHEVLAVQMLRRRDQHRIDRLVLQQIAVIEVGLRVRRDLLRGLEAARVDVGEGDELGVRAGDRFMHDCMPRSPVR